MTRVSRLVPALLGLLGATCACGLAAVSCSSSSGGSQDAGQDSTADAKNVSDAGADQGDGTVSDTGSGGDADGSVATDSSLDGSLSITTFATQVAATFCSRIAACCGTSGDAATFAWSTCIADQLPTGFKGSSTGAYLVSAGHVTFNATAAQACLDGLEMIDCTANQVVSQVSAQLYANCFGAYTGTLSAGAPCNASIECTSGNYCLPLDGGTVDGGATGVCTALAGDGGACNQLGTNATYESAQSVCSYRGSGNNGLFCKSFDPATPKTPLDPSLWTCAPQEALNTGCLQNVDCTSFTCPGTYQCGTADPAVSPSTCAAFEVSGGD